MSKILDVNNSPLFAACTPENPTFHADSAHWYLSKGIVGINNVFFIQKTSPNEQNLDNGHQKKAKLLQILIKKEQYEY